MKTSETVMQKITPFLWFDHDAEEAAKLYVSIFKNSKILTITPGPGGRAMTVTLELDGQKLIALNGGPHYKLNEAFSLSVSCANQAEVDELCAKLTEGGGAQGRCAWLKDRYGLSWQIVPTRLGELMGDPDAAKAQRVMQAMLKMDKIDIAALERAHAGK